MRKVVLRRENKIEESLRKGALSAHDKASQLGELELNPEEELKIKHLSETVHVAGRSHPVVIRSILTTECRHLATKFKLYQNTR